MRPLDLASTRAGLLALRAFEGFVLHALTDVELERMCALVYDKAPWHRGLGIEDWEHAWWTARLPKPPARVLVGGCGAGRELAWLLARGYDVVGFDPAGSLARIARTRAPRARVDVMGYREFVDDAAYAAREQPRKRRADIADFDAIILGWGSFSHVLSVDARRELLSRCARACPTGPVLVSWLGAPPASTPRESIARRLGLAVGALRGIARDASADVIMLHTGPAHQLTSDEVAALASDAGLRFVDEGGDYPHATLRPSPSPSKRARAKIDDAAIELFADVLAAGRAAHMIARGGSMREAIPHRSRLTIEPVESAWAPISPKWIGDVLAFRKRGDPGLVVHRVIGVDARGRLLMKGDACDAPDGWVDASDVLGRVTRVNDGPVPPPRAQIERWRRAFGRLRRAATALTRPPHAG